MERDASQCNDQCNDAFCERQFVFGKIPYPVRIAFLILLERLGVQSMMRMQLEPYIAGTIRSYLATTEVKVTYIKKAMRSITEVVRLICRTRSSNSESGYSPPLSEE